MAGIAWGGPRAGEVRFVRFPPKSIGIKVGDTVWVDQHGFPWSEAEKARYDATSDFQKVFLAMSFTGPYRYEGRTWPRFWRARVTCISPEEGH